MCADEAYCSGRDAGKQSPPGSSPHLSSPCYALPAPLPICRPQTHYCRLVYPAGPWLWAGASGNGGLSNHQTVIYKGGPAT